MTQSINDQQTTISQTSDLRHDLIFMGRKEELFQLTRNLQKGRHTLLVGDKGIGKTRLMQEARWILSGRILRIEFAASVIARIQGGLSKRMRANQYKIVYIEHPNPLGECLKELAEQLYYNGDLRVETAEARLDWPLIKKRLTGLGSSKLQALIFESITRSDKPYLIFFDNLDRVSPSQHAFLETILNIAVVCTAVVTIKEHFVYKRIWSSFVRIDLEPLHESVCRKLIDFFFDHYSVRAIDKDLFRMEILKAANGNPFFIKTMLWHGSLENYVNMEEIRNLRRVQQGHYFNMGPAYIFSASVFTIFKIFSLGTDNKEFYIYFSALGVLVYITFRVFRAFFLFRPQKYN
ncbi:MAG: ATP-binding protein [Ignavibacteriae bacterium]|nr:ATP-binding protein [Ignavibacteriota bacterium]